MKIKAKLLEIYRYYGWRHQLRKLHEEQREVRQAIWLYKWRIKHSSQEAINSAKRDIEQEVADNFVLLGQFIYGEDLDPEQIKAWIEAKTLRTLRERGHERIGR